MISNSHALILTAALCLGAPGAAHAECQGHDLFPALKSETPAAYAAIETAANAMPFGHGRLFHLSRAGSEPSYVFATLHVPDPRITNFSPRVRAALSGSKIVALEFGRDRGHSSAGDCEESGRVAPRDGGQWRSKSRSLVE